MTTLPFNGEIGLGNVLRLRSRSNAVIYRFQNYFFGESTIIRGESYTFIPFGFSGLSVSKQGDLDPASLVFANNGLSRSFISEALRGGDINDDDYLESVREPYVAEVEVLLIDPYTEERNKLYTYTGQCSSANWNDTEAILELSGILDAVKGDIPTRTLRKDLVGNLPTSSTVRIR